MGRWPERDGGAVYSLNASIPGGLPMVRGRRPGVVLVPGVGASFLGVGVLDLRLGVDDLSFWGESEGRESCFYILSPECYFAFSFTPHAGRRLKKEVDPQLKKKTKKKNTDIYSPYWQRKSRVTPKWTAHGNPI